MKRRLADEAINRACRAAAGNERFQITAGDVRAILDGWPDQLAPVVADLRALLHRPWPLPPYRDGKRIWMPTACIVIVADTWRALPESQEVPLWPYL